MKSKGGQGAREIVAGGSRFSRSFPVPCGTMTVIGVSALPQKRLMPMEKNLGKLNCYIRRG